MRWVNEPPSVGDLRRLRHSASRGRPYGGEAWTRETAIRLGLGSCLRPRGRPRKEQSVEAPCPRFPAVPVFPLPFFRDYLRVCSKDGI
jgi:hypothetical protein